MMIPVTVRYNLEGVATLKLANVGFKLVCINGRTVIQFLKSIIPYNKITVCLSVYLYQRISITSGPMGAAKGVKALSFKIKMFKMDVRTLW